MKISMGMYMLDYGVYEV